MQSGCSAPYAHENILNEESEYLESLKRCYFALESERNAERQDTTKPNRVVREFLGERALMEVLDNCETNREERFILTALAFDRCV